MIVDEPIIAVSQSGATVAIGTGADLLLVDSRSGAVTTTVTPLSPAIVAVAPTRANEVVVASESSLCRVGSRDDGVLELPGRAMLVRVGDEGTVVTVTRSDAEGTHLVVHTGPTLEPAIEPTLLGPAAAWGLEIDEPSETAVLWGVTGEQAWEGRGKSYVRRVAWGSGTAEVDWSGAGLPPEPGLLRTGGGRLVAVAGDRLQTSTVRALVEDGRPDGVDIAVPDGVDRLAISPDGAVFAIERAGLVSTARFGDETLVRRGEAPREFSPMVLAVGPDGTIVLCGFADTVTVVGLVAQPGGDLTEAWRLETAEMVHEDL